MAELNNKFKEHLGSPRMSHFQLQLEKTPTFGQMKLLIDIIRNADNSGKVEWPVHRVMMYDGQTEFSEEWAKGFISSFIDNMSCTFAPKEGSAQTKKTNEDIHLKMLSKAALVWTKDDKPVMVFSLSDFAKDHLWA